MWGMLGWFLVQGGIETIVERIPSNFFNGFKVENLPHIDTGMQERRIYFWSPGVGDTMDTPLSFLIITLLISWSHLFTNE